MSTPQSLLRDVHSIVSNRFIEQLEKGIMPWHIVWNEHPQNITGWPFDHINVWLLAHLPYQRKVFLTEKQIKRYKATVKEGERGHQIVGIRHRKSTPTFHCSHVYNIEQLQGISDTLVPPLRIPANPKQACEELVSQMPKLPFIIWDASPVYYSLKADTILLPDPDCFESEAQYYSSLFYAFAQCTGHQKRRNRDTAINVRRVDPKTYSCEELITEMTTGYLCCHTGIEPWYLKHYHADSSGWLRRLKMDNTIAITAAMYAQEAVNYILNRSPLFNLIQTGVYRPEAVKE